MNPYLLLAGALAWAASIGGAVVYGQGVGEARCVASQAAVDKAVEQTRTAAQEGAAKAIAANRPRNVTIRQETEREIQTRTEYRDCRHGPDGVRLVNEALTGRAEPTGAGQLPGADAAAR